MNANKTVMLFIIMSVITVLLLTVGYSAGKKTMYISDSQIKVKVDKDVRITNVTVNNVASGAIANGEDFNSKKIFLDATLPNSSSTITYNVEVKNFGNVPVGIPNINCNNDAISLTVQPGIVGNILENGGTTLGITKTFTITVGYKNGMTGNANFPNLEIGIDFAAAYNVSISGLTFTPQPTDLVAFENLTYSLNLQSSNYHLRVKMGGVQISNYTFTNGVLSIPNVSGDIEIEAHDTTGVDLVIDETVTDIPVSQISAENPITNLTDFFAIGLNGSNFGNKIISQIDVTLKYTTSTGASQKVDIKLTHKGTTKTQTVTFMGNKSTPTDVTVSFTGLNISNSDTFTITNAKNKVNNNQVTITSEIIHLTYK